MFEGNVQAGLTDDTDPRRYGDVFSSNAKNSKIVLGVAMVSLSSSLRATILFKVYNDCNQVKLF